MAGEIITMPMHIGFSEGWDAPPEKQLKTGETKVQRNPRAFIQTWNKYIRDSSLAKKRNNDLQRSL